MCSLGNLLISAVYLLAVARVVRFVNHDTLADPLRNAVVDRALDEDRSDAERHRWRLLAQWMDCAWCVSVWVIAATLWIPLHYAHHPVVQYVGLGLAAAHLIGVAARFADDDPTEQPTVV